MEAFPSGRSRPGLEAAVNRVGIKFMEELHVFGGYSGSKKKTEILE